MFGASFTGSETPARQAPFWRRVALTICLSVSATKVLATDVNDTAYFVIDSQQLASALIQFSQQSDVSIVFSDRLMRGFSAPPIIGTIALDEALDTLLQDTGLSWELVDERVIAVFGTRCGQQDGACYSPQEIIKKYPVYVPGIEETYVYGTQITGSRIRRSGYTGGAPVDILSSPDIELSGAQTLGELLKFVPAVSGNSASTAISNGGDGTATVTLRGLPASNTLVLINGRRIANDGLAGDSVDLNSIPPAAVKRIEILKDGASAIYGSDAIAGVVNIIMKRDFHGFLAETFYGQTQAGDQATTTQTLQYGMGLPEGSLFISASRYEQDPIYSRDRDVSRSADTRALGGSDQRSSATPSARIVLPEGNTVIATASGYRPASDEDLFNYQHFTTAVVPMKRTSLYGNASYDFSEQITGLVEFSYADTDARAMLAPTPVFTAFEQQPLVIAADNIYNTFDTELTDVRRRLLELPNRTQRNESKVERYSVAIEGLFADWNWDFGFNWSRSEATETTANIVNADNLRLGLGPATECATHTGCVPINLLGPAGSLSAEQVDYISATGEVSGYTKLSTMAANFNRAVPGLAAGRIDLAFGIEHRDESTSKRPSQLLASTSTIGATNFEATRGSRQITELYIETLLPIWKSDTGLKSLDLEAAMRYSHYSDFGSATNPKFTLRWQINPQLLLRGTIAEGFRAPSLNELYEGNTEEQAFLTDPCTLPQNIGVLPGCTQLADDTRNQFLVVKGGNASLKPETSDSRSFGLVWTPTALAGLAASVDYFEIKQRDVVSSSAQYIVNQNASNGAFADSVQRDAIGNLTLVTANNINIGRREVSGVDAALTYHLPKHPWGQLSVVGGTSWIDQYLARLDSTAPKLDLAGTFRDEASEGLGGIPKWKSQLGVRWNHQRWRASYQLNYVSSLRETIPDTSTRRSIDSWTVHDAQLNYTFDVWAGLRWTLGVDNLLDEEAPLATSAFNDNIDGRTHELKGRYWYTRLSLRL